MRGVLYSHRRLDRFDQPPQILDGVAGHQVVVEAGLVVGVGQVQVFDAGAFGSRIRPARATPSAPFFAGHVAVEREDHPPPVERDVMPVGQRHLAASAVGAAASSTLRTARRCTARGSQPQSAFLHALGDPQRHVGSPSIGADAGRHVEAVALLPRCLVFDRLAVARPRDVGPVLVSPGRAVDAQQRHQQAGNAAARRGDDFSSARRQRRVGDGFVAARPAACSGVMPDAASMARWSGLIMPPPRRGGRGTGRAGNARHGLQTMCARAAGWPTRRCGNGGEQWAGSRDHVVPGPRHWPPAVVPSALPSRLGTV